MTEAQLDLLKEWMIAQIEAEIESRQEDESGYRPSAHAEHKRADELFERLKRTCITRGDKE